MQTPRTTPDDSRAPGKTGDDASATRRSILWVDAYLEYSSPTMRHLLYALPRLRAEGWEIKAWCLRSDAPPAEVKHTFFPTHRWLRPVETLYFSLVVNLYGILRWLRREPRPATIIHANCGTYLAGELASVHFVNCVWLRKQLELGFANWKERVLFLVHCCGAVFERLHWWSPALRLVLPVSDSVGEEVRRRTRADVAIETLPNGYDETRFNPAVRTQWREPIRAELGVSASDVVFAFSSLGHYKRKGFWLAVEAITRLRSDPTMSRVRFLVIGGNPAALSALKVQLETRAPDWKQWLIFTGHQPAVEKYLSAADAFLYPSYFEAFCLAEIEAAALGIPLLLTRHHGSEMILEDGVNGLWLDYDPAALADTLRRFIQTDPRSFRHSVGRALTRAQYTGRLLSIYEKIWSERSAVEPG